MFTVKEIAEATGGAIQVRGSRFEVGAAPGGGDSGAMERRVSGVSTDSRTAISGQLFVPLKGEKFDGHDYLAALFAKGVKTALVEDKRSDEFTSLDDATLIAVPDTLVALGDLARSYRKRFSLPIVGITGSNGKTTTKEMLAAILASNGEGLKTSGNLNNLIGLPQMVFQLKDEHKWAVFEMGMSEFGEIDRLAEIAAPDIGIITNAYPAHLASMGSVAGVARAKGELFSRLLPGSTAIYNADDALISACPTSAGVIRRGFGLRGAEITAVDLKSCGNQGQSFTLKVGEKKAELMLHAFGLHNVYNALAAAAAADSLGLSMDAIVSGLASFSPYDKRFKLEDLGPIVLIDDSYNSNPASTGAALLTLQGLKRDKRAIAVLGDMLELGEESLAAHRDVGHLAASCADRLYLYGKMGQAVAEAALEAGMPDNEVVCAASHAEILSDIVKDHLDGDYILIKGSRGMRMDIVSAALRETFSSPGYSGGRS
ncbi:MAG: UDP-N-acetylmuramoyl-tripeptide--D-alanyl-D-alanine ligase [Deltaproteobacteria bacterium HGW-Deltaproteobacteria-23]|nr:MAG: UDP-N-acetylmuramoyl-tripeptide--D-alanyl-D-alanine ligase [Deltaproteobacteria bacterium HGW-Deltaproteobacteria-23]